MAKRRETPGQYSFDDYRLKEVDVRLKLMDGPSYYSNKPLSSPKDAVDVMRDVLKELDREWVCVVNMDNHLKPVNFNVVSIGSINQSLAPIQNIFKSAILSNCSNLMLLHNHPSGDIEPSSEDRRLTVRLVEAAKLMDMQLLDHVIVGGQTGEIFSFRKDNPRLFDSRDIDLGYIHQMTGEVKGRGTAYRPKGYDPKKAAEARKQEMQNITEKLEQGVLAVFDSSAYRKFLDTMARFPRYSVNNSLLIMMQKPDATAVQSYTAWQRMGRQVKRGEKGIRILAPTPYRIQKEQERIGVDGKVVLDRDGEPVTDRVEISMMAFKLVSTFDVSQTEGDPLPTLGADELRGEVANYETMFEAMKNVSPVPVSFEDMNGGAKGYFSILENRIAIRNGMDEIQNVKTLVHEMAHAKLHSMAAQKAREGGEQTRNSKEVEAESVAYMVCQHFGMDTGEYSFGYIAGWSEGRQMPELKESLQTIRDASSEMIGSIEEAYRDLSCQKEIRKDLLEELSDLAGKNRYDLQSDVKPGDRRAFDYALHAGFEKIASSAACCLEGEVFQSFAAEAKAKLDAPEFAGTNVSGKAFLEHIDRNPPRREEIRAEDVKGVEHPEKGGPEEKEPGEKESKEKAKEKESGEKESVTERLRAAREKTKEKEVREPVTSRGKEH